MDFEKVFEVLLKEFRENKVQFALIGGFALASAGYARATEDIDFMAAKEDISKVKQIMRAQGYELLHESDDVANFSNKKLDFGKVDFLYAHRKYAKEMLARAQENEILRGRFKIKVLKSEDLIGLKVQSSSNDPSRHYRDMADIEALIRANFSSLDMERIRQYFDLFERGSELTQILSRINK